VHGVAPLALTKVTYPPDPGPVFATYAYDAEGRLQTADDPHFAGPMRTINYKYRGTFCTRPVATPTPPLPAGYYDRFYAHANSIAAERSGSYLDQSGQPVTVSSFDLRCLEGTRWETNGLGAWRVFYFGNSPGQQGTYLSHGYELAKLTDFTTANPIPASLPFVFQNHDQGQPRQVWDGRKIMSELVVTAGDDSGEPGEIRHVGSDGSSYKYDRVNPGSSLARDITRIPNPYNHWLFSKTDENQQKTTYTRDARRRITRIDYPGGPGGISETFAYNAFNQITSHGLPSGAVETKTYYAAGHPSQYLLWQEWNSVDGGATNATVYTYDSLGRVATVSEPRNRTAIPAKDFSTRMTYNARHQVTKVEYAGMLTGTVNPSVSYEYDAYGNCTAITNELGDRSTYTYDDYRRCTSYTEPLAAPGWNGSGTVAGRTWNWAYDRVGVNNQSIPASAHTSKEWRLQIEPPFDAAGNRRAKVRNYDYNDRLTFEYDSIIQAPDGSWTYPADAAMHSYTYDENGQTKSYTDPRTRVTTYTYDNRNRLFQTIEPLQRTTATLYDVTGNKTKVTFPDAKTQEWLNYDPFGQPRQFKDERSDITDLSYQWGPMKKLDTVTTYRLKDNNAGTEPQPTNFEYDGMGRKTWTIFPDGSTELNSYLYGQVDAFKTRKAQTKRIHYDARGREDYHTWDADEAPRVDRQWDEANRLAKVWNSFSTINYTYDDAGQVWTESNTIAGAAIGQRQIIYARYPNGDPAHITYPNGFRLRRDYTMRGQLQTTGTDASGGTWISKFGQYAYFNDGKTQTVMGLDGVQTTYDYDSRGQMNLTRTEKPSWGRLYSSRTYTRDTRDRISAWSKSSTPANNPLENGRGDRYGYDAEGQLTAASYEALTPAGTPTGAERTESFAYDALGNRVGMNYLAGRGWMDFLRRDNKLNQYSSWTPSLIYYDDNYPGWGPPPKGNGVMMAEGWITASYNALNQPEAIWSPAYNGTPNLMWFGFDPLGRCVKRWVGPNADATGSTPTYFYYEGWDLLQEDTGTATASRIYLHGNRVDDIASDYDYTTLQWHFHHYDARGHCILLTDRNGNLVEQYDYDAFGKPYFYNGSGTPLANGSAFKNRFLFTGREWLSELKLYDYRNRLYQPELGRFLQPDPKQFAAGDYNLYRYCHNDPVNKSDPTGEYVTYSDDWSDADAEIFKQGFEQLWNDPAQRGQLEQMYASEDEYRISPDRSSGTPAQGATKFNFAENPRPQQPSNIFQQLSDAIRNIPNSLGMGQGNQNFEKNPQGDNTAANTRAEAAARKEGLSDTQREIFHDAIHGRNLNFQKLREEAKLIKDTYPNK
jgi:RHS repeat-associated protein